MPPKGTQPRKAHWLPAPVWLTALFLLLTQPGCILVILGLMSAPIAVGGFVAGTAIGTRTAYVNLRDYYEALEGEETTPEVAVTLKGLRLINDNRSTYNALTHTVAPHGFTPESYVLTAQLARKDGQREEELSTNLAIRRFPFRDIVKDLTNRKYIEVRTIEGATKFVFYGTTTLGREKLENARRSLEHLRFEYLRRLSLDDRRTLTRLVAKAVAESDSPAAGGTGGILGLTTGGEAEFLLAKMFVLAHWEEQRFLAEYALSDPEFQILSTLWLREELGPRTLTSITQMPREEFGRTAQGMINQGYLDRTDKITEEGSYLLRLGPQAIKLKQRMQPEVDSFHKRIFYRLNEQEQTELANIFYKMGRGVVG